MSWSISVIGTPEAIVNKLDALEATLSGASLAEYQEAKPHLQGLMRLHVNNNSLVHLTASGHATFRDGEKTQGYVAVDLKQIYGVLA